LPQKSCTASAPTPPRAGSAYVEQRNIVTRSRFLVGRAIYRKNRIPHFLIAL